MTIIVSPLHQAIAAFQRHGPTRVISLLSPNMAPIALPIADHARLQLTFNDIVAERDGLIAPSPAHLAALLGFLDDWDRRSPILIHCWAGVSRSTAAGYIAACLREPPGSEDRLAQALRRAARFATPNARLVGLADEILGRDGRMTAAIAAIGRGAETGLGEAFEL